MTKTTTKAKTTKQTPAAQPSTAQAVVWSARDAYGDFCGLLVTEPGNLDAPIAFLFHNQESTDPTEMQFARLIAANPDRLDYAVDYGTEHPVCRMDLRDRGRTGALRPMPGWVYGLTLCPETAEQREELQIPWNPFCPIRLAMMLAKKPAA